MKAVVLHGPDNYPNNYEVMDIEKPTCGKRDILLKMKAAALCGTDKRIFTGGKTKGVRPDSVVGHEICGLIEEVGEEVKGFEVGEKVDATAVSKGKGFQGAIKRFNQHRGPMTHGSKYHRHAGSNGSASDPSKVFKGKGMPGQMGGEQVTVQNLEVVRVDAENNLLLVKGAVPGPKKSLVTIRDAVKA